MLCHRILIQYQDTTMIIIITITLIVTLGLMQLVLNHRTTSSMYSRNTSIASTPISMPAAVKYTSFDVTEHMILEGREMTRDAKCVVEFFTFS